MRLTDVVRLRLRSLLSRSTVENELDEELQYHLDRQIDENIAAGMSDDRARQAAIRSVAGLEQRKEECRDARGVNLVDNARQDVRFSLRQLRQNLGFTSTAILTISLGFGASVAIFGFVDAALIRPLPYRDPARLVGVTESVALIPRAALSYLDYLDWKKLNMVFSSLEVYNGRGYMLRTATGSELVHGERVSDGFFRTLGVAPALGRDFVAGEDLPGAPNTVMLSYAAWQRRFGGRPNALGQHITLSGTPYTITGVLPEDFEFAPTGGAEFWTTLHAEGSCDTRRSCHNLEGIARLNDGVSVEAALANVTTIARQLEAQYPDSNRGQGASVVPLSTVIVGDIKRILLVLLAGAGLLLLLACVNVASLLLVRSESRHRELAVRSALGASPARLIRQFATEGVVLVALGSALGLVLAYWIMQLPQALVPAGMRAGMPFLGAIGLNPRVMGFAAAVSLAATLLFAITPTLRLSFSGMREGMAEGSRGSAGTTWQRLGSKLVVVELATAVVLLVGAGLLGRSFYELLHVDLGFRPDHLATLEIALPRSPVASDATSVRLGHQIMSRVSSLPGVQSVAVAMQVPVSFNGNTDWIRLVGQPYHGEHNEVNQRDVSASYFATVGATLDRGRYFTEHDDASKPKVVIINQALARKYFQGVDPIGKQIGDTDLTPGSLKEVVGIIDDIREGPLDAEIWPAVYYPFDQSPDTYFALLVRTSQDEESVLPMLTSAVHEIDLDIGTKGEATMAGRISESQSAYLHRSSAWLVGGFAALALLLGVVGLYGVVAYSVSQRTREIGVRMALGAEQRSVYTLILREAGWLIAGGIVIGLVCSVGAASMMRELLFGVESWDVPTLAAVSLALGVSALLASYIPARRAASVNPVDALRAE